MATKRLGIRRTFFKRHGSNWEFVRNSTFGKAVLHTCGCSYEHDLGSNRNVTVWSWDSNGNAITVKKASIEEMYKHLIAARKTFKLVCRK